MREIKYRQWIKSTKSFHYWGYIIEHEHEDIFGKYFQDPFGPMDNDKRESQQYTGLKDKNGKEIYEGDILGYPKQPWRFVRWEKDEAGFVLNCLAPVENSWDCFDEYLPDNDLTIIGNIYENKELLERKK